MTPDDFDLTSATPRRTGRAIVPCCVAAAIVCALTLAPTLARAQESSPAPESSPLRVGIRQAPPFAIKEDDGAWSGIAVQLWESVAAALGRSYALEERELADLFDGLERGELDVAIGALTVTAEREARVDFTHPFHSSGLGIAVSTRGDGSLLTPLRRLFSPAFLNALGALTLVLLVTGALMWLLERRKNPEQFGGSVLRGLGEGFWWSAVTMTTVGYGDRTPTTKTGRVVALVWMFASVITISGFTAAIASTLTIGSLDSGLRGPQDLPGRRVGALAGTTGATYLAARSIDARRFPDAPTALAALAAGELQAVVHDAPILRFFANARFRSQVTVLPQKFEPQQYAIALQPGSALREPATRAVLAEIHRERFERVLAQYLGD